MIFISDCNMVIKNSLKGKKKLMKKLKNLTSEYVQLKLNQYEEIVNLFKSFFEYSNIEETEETFELAKQIILNNENMRSKIILSETIKLFWIYCFKYISFFIPFFLGLLKNENGTILNSKFLLWTVISAFMYIFLSTLEDNAINYKSMPKRMIENITYGQYCTLKDKTVDISEEIKILNCQIYSLEKQIEALKKTTDFENLIK